MKIELLRCTNCGYDIDRMPEGSFVTCGACGATNVVEIAAEFAKVEVDRSGDIRNLRTVLKRALGVNDIDGIVSAAGKVLELIPDDYAARYYYAYACGAKGVNKYISGFYADPPGVCTEEELQGIAEHINTHSDLRDKAVAEGYLERLDDGGKSLREYREQYSIRAREEDNYDVYERDIFVCHRSTDKEVVERAVSVLERDGNTCWVSYRNLRPNDSHNYWHNIEANMRECKVFLVISSGDAMMSGDVRRELMIAKGIEHLRRVEYKIDDEPHTSAFKDFFRGRKWIDGCGADNKCYQSLSRRIFEELEIACRDKQADKQAERERIRREIEAEVAKRQEEEELRRQAKELEREKRRLEELKAGAGAVTVAAPGQTGNITGLIRRAGIDIDDGMFDTAKEILDSALNAEPENGEIWWLLLRCEFKAKDESMLSDWAYTQEVLKSRNYRNAVRFGGDGIKAKSEAVTKAEAAREEEFVRRAEEAKVRQEKERIRREAEARKLQEREEREKAERIERFKQEEAQKKKEAERRAEAERREAAERQRVAKEEAARAAEKARLKADNEAKFDIVGTTLYSYKGRDADVIIPEGVTSIGDKAFCEHKGIRSVIIPEGVTVIDWQAFYNSSLNTVAIPASLKSIIIQAFNRCEQLTGFSVAEGNPDFKSQDGVLFTKDMKTLLHYPASKEEESYSVPQGVTDISGGNFTFQGCKNLKTVIIPDSITAIDNNAFYDCKSLQSVVIPESVTSVGTWAFFGCESLKAAVIPESLKSIGSRAFCGCRALVSITIPEGVTSIEEGAFDGFGKSQTIYFRAHKNVFGRAWKRGCKAKIVWGYKG